MPWHGEVSFFVVPHGIKDKDKDVSKPFALFDLFFLNQSLSDLVEPVLPFSRSQLDSFAANIPMIRLSCSVWKIRGKINILD